MIRWSLNSPRSPFSSCHWFSLGTVNQDLKRDTFSHPWQHPDHWSYPTCKARGIIIWFSLTLYPCPCIPQSWRSRTSTISLEAEQGTRKLKREESENLKHFLKTVIIIITTLVTINVIFPNALLTGNDQVTYSF